MQKYGAFGEASTKKSRQEVTKVLGSSMMYGREKLSVFINTVQSIVQEAKCKMDDVVIDFFAEGSIFNVKITESRSETDEEMIKRLGRDTANEVLAEENQRRADTTKERVCS